MALLKRARDVGRVRAFASTKEWFPMKAPVSEKSTLRIVGALALLLTACGHAYATPVVTRVQTGPDLQSDVAWIVEDGGRVLRCVNGPDRPVCTRAEVH